MGKTVTAEFAVNYPGKTRNPFDPSAHPRRLFERIGSGGGRFHGAARARDPDDGLDDQARLVLRRVRLPPDLRRRALLGRHGVIGIVRHGGSLRTHRRGHRASSRRADRRGPGAAPRRCPARRESDSCVHRNGTNSNRTPSGCSKTQHAASRLPARKSPMRRFPPEFERAEEAHRLVTCREFALNFTREIEHHLDDLSEDLRNGKIRIGFNCSFERYREAQALRETLPARSGRSVRTFRCAARAVCRRRSAGRLEHRRLDPRLTLDADAYAHDERSRVQRPERPAGGCSADCRGRRRPHAFRSCALDPCSTDVIRAEMRPHRDVSRAAALSLQRPVRRTAMAQSDRDLKGATVMDDADRAAAMNELEERHRRIADSPTIARSSAVSSPVSKKRTGSRPNARSASDQFHADDNYFLHRSKLNDQGRSSPAIGLPPPDGIRSAKLLRGRSPIDYRVPRRSASIRIVSRPRRGPFSARPPPCRGFGCTGSAANPAPTGKPAPSCRQTAKPCRRARPAALPRPDAAHGFCAKSVLVSSLFPEIEFCAPLPWSIVS